MNYCHNVYENLMDKLANMFAVSDAIKEIKNNPAKYPEFDFWVPGYDAEGWTEKAIKDFDELVPEFSKVPIVFKLIFMRHYRKLGQTYRKKGKKELVGSKQFCVDVILTIKKLHPEFFKREV